MDAESQLYGNIEARGARFFPPEQLNAGRSRLGRQRGLRRQEDSKAQQLAMKPRQDVGSSTDVTNPPLRALPCFWSVSLSVHQPSSPCVNLTLLHLVPIGRAREQPPRPRPQERVDHHQVRAAAPEPFPDEERRHLVPLAAATAAAAAVCEAAGEQREAAAKEDGSRQLRRRPLRRKQARIVHHERSGHPRRRSRPSTGVLVYSMGRKQKESAIGGYVSPADVSVQAECGWPRPPTLNMALAWKPLHPSRLGADSGRRSQTCI